MLYTLNMSWTSLKKISVVGAKNLCMWHRQNGINPECKSCGWKHSGEKILRIHCRMGKELCSNCQWKNIKKKKKENK